MSNDLKGRVIAAVEAGATGRAVAERFGIDVTTAIRWVRVFRTIGATSVLPKGGDLRSHCIEALGMVILGAIKGQTDIMLAELAAMLGREHGARFTLSTVHRFRGRNRVTLKKKTLTPPSRTGPTWPTGGRPGSTRA